MFPGPTESYKFISLSFLSSLCLCMCVFLVNIKQKFNESSQVDSLKLFFQQHLGLHPLFHLLSGILCLFAVLMHVLIYLFFIFSHSVLYLWVVACLCSCEISLCLETSPTTHISNEGNSKDNADFFVNYTIYLWRLKV